MKKNRTETIEEFLARGGKVTVLETVRPKDKIEIAITHRGSKEASMMSLWDAQMYFGEKEGRPSSKESTTRSKDKLNLDALPEALKRRLLEKLNRQE